MKLSGYICIRNNFDLDYCAEAAVCSLIPVCDEVVICDSDSTDGTREWAEEFARRDSRVRVINYPWPDPKAQIAWWTDWLNFTREHLTHEMQLELDADEVLCPGSYDTIRAAVAAGEVKWFWRLNFWSDGRHLAPLDELVGSKVVRLAPTRMWMCSDELHPEGEPEIRLTVPWPPIPDPPMRIFHYGFIRRHEAFLRKWPLLTRAFFGTIDERCVKAQESGRPWMEMMEGEAYPYQSPLVPFEGEHPAVARNWLRERGCL